MKTKLFTLIVFLSVSIISFSASVESLQKIRIPERSALSLVIKAFDKVSDNYPCENYLMDGYYRESITNDGYAVSVNEAILGIGKASYNNFLPDKVSVKSARTTTPKIPLRDPVALKLQAGPCSALMTDIAKFSLPGAGKFCELLNDKYMFWYGDPEYINGIPFLTVIFDQRYPGEELLCRGKIFIEPGSYAIGRIEFCLNVETSGNCTLPFIKKGSSSVDTDVCKASYIVNYSKKDDKWFLSTSESEVIFTLNRDKAEAPDKYTVKSQLALTDYVAGNFKANKEDILKPNQLLAEFNGKNSESGDWEMFNVTLNRLFAQKSSSPEPDIHVN